jgi:hypothetical protein
VADARRISVGDVARHRLAALALVLGDRTAYSGRPLGGGAPERPLVILMVDVSPPL